MKSRSSLGFAQHCIEPLEARIAPARIIIVGVPANLPGGSSDVDYNEAPFVNTELAVGDSDSIAQAVGGGVVGKADTFYMRLSEGDVLKVYNSGNGPEEYLRITSGNVVAFFVDKNLNNEVEAGELVSLSLGKNVGLILKSGVAGSIVTNLNENGTPKLTDDFIELNSVVGAGQGIKGLRIGAGVGGSIIAGGTINDVNIGGTVQGILAGTSADQATYTVFPGLPDGLSGMGKVSFSQPSGKAGASINKIVVKGADRILAGNGGDGAVGGALSFIQVLEDANGMILKAGDGGNSSDTVRKGGEGGSVGRVYISGTGDGVANDAVDIRAGKGGMSSTGTGGDGGHISSVYVGFQLVGSVRFASGSLLADNVLVAAGNGGSGKVGGTGGLIVSSRVLVSTPDRDGEEISFYAGTGGDNSDSLRGRTGAGGSINKVRIENRSPVGASGILVNAGDGGNSAGTALGAVGGSVNDLKLIGANLKVYAGNGSAGFSGGAGGSLSHVTVLDAVSVLAVNGNFRAGFGGDGQANGGKGGDISFLNVQNGDFNVLNINDGASANGGNGRDGLGGAGGSVLNLDVTEGRLATATNGELLLRSGTGGNGFGDGGRGGAIDQASLVTADMKVTVLAGNGGKGINQQTLAPHRFGGAGGVISGVQILAEGNFGITPVPVLVQSGLGGSGVQGGEGGKVKAVSMRVQGDGTLVAGSGGTGTRLAGGLGGSVFTSVVYATLGKAKLLAGDGGANGALAAPGGNIAGTPISLIGVYGAQDLEVRAGNGNSGGSGGSIRFVGYGSTSTELVPTPDGNILIQAGNGSDGLRIAGDGGSVRNVSGSVGSKMGSVTEINAGKGGSSTVFGGRGGSITNLIVERGGGPDVELRITAGNAGNGVSALTGATGGSVKTISVSNLEEGTAFRSIGAGDGGVARNGGAGGSVDGVRVLDHEIGIRSGEDFGYDSMGGIFTGLGGVGSRSNGLNGNVKNVSAEAIAAIVAGKSLIPQAANVVAFVTVNGPDLLFESRGALQHGFLGATMVYNFNGETTDPIPANSSAADLQAVLNGLPSVGTAGGVTVTGNAETGFVVHFAPGADQSQITGEQTFSVLPVEIVNGEFPITVTEDREGDNFPIAREVQSFVVDATAKFTVYFDEDPFALPSALNTTPQLAPSTTADQLTDALNALDTIQEAGGVSVVLDSLSHKFVVTFNTPDNYSSLVVSGQREEVQRLDLYKTGQFEVSFGGDSTGRLNFDASAADVQAALNGLASIQGLAEDGVSGSVTVTAKPNAAFDIHFNVAGGQEDFVLTQYSGIVGTTVTQGAVDAGEVQNLAVLSPVFFVADETVVPNLSNLHTGNFVGAIADVQAFNGPQFKFVDTNTNGIFDPGEQPIDGLIFAHKIVQSTLNFTPEARVVDQKIDGVLTPVFYDFLNRI